MRSNSRNWPGVDAVFTPMCRRASCPRSSPDFSRRCRPALKSLFSRTIRTVTDWNAPRCGHPGIRLDPAAEQRVWRQSACQRGAEPLGIGRALDAPRHGEGHGCCGEVVVGHVAHEGHERTCDILATAGHVAPARRPWASVPPRRTSLIFINLRSSLRTHGMSDSQRRCRHRGRYLSTNAHSPRKR
jgi:hypothetical protein